MFLLFRTLIYLVLRCAPRDRHVGPPTLVFQYLRSFIQKGSFVQSELSIKLKLLSLRYDVIFHI